jgi:uncharacterized membrane protein
MIAKLLSNFRDTMIVSVSTAVILIVAYVSLRFGPETFTSAAFIEATLRWLHVFFGILWIGLLYYFNFVQIRVMPNIPAELKPAVSKHIAPEALFWFRWAALLTLVVGLLLALYKGYLIEALTFTVANHVFIGIGMWLAIIMAAFVWMVIWPNQKIALGLVEASAEDKAKAARKAMLFSRTNALLSIPMLATMAMHQTLG